MDYRLEVIVLPASDVHRALVFYTDQVGFALDVDYHPSADFRVVQLTPPGSSCSIQIVSDPSGGRPSPVRSSYLVVDDIEAARRELLGRGVEVGPIRHKSPADDWRGDWAPDVDPHRGDYASFADFADPDGNNWVLQERTDRSPRWPPPRHRTARPGRHTSTPDTPCFSKRARPPEFTSSLEGRS